MDLSEVIASYLFNKETKASNYQEVLDFNNSDKTYLLSSENEYRNAITSKKGFFNVIIIETMKYFKSCFPNETQKLEEAFNVLWSVLERTDLPFSVVEQIRSKLAIVCPGLDIDNILSVFSSENGKNLVEKFSGLLGSVLEDKVEDVKQSKCCMCIRTTINVAEKVVAAIIPYVPAILEIVLNIIAIV